MQSLTAIDAGDVDEFVIHLVQPLGNAARIASLELVLPDMRNRYSFKEQRTLDETFIPEIAVGIQDVLVSLNKTQRIVSLPDFAIAVPDLVLLGLRILVTDGEDGSTYLMLRFRKFMGTVKRAFLFETSGKVDAASMREKIAVEVLNDIVTPLFDIMSLSNNGLDHLIENHSKVLHSRIQELSSRQEEITFYISMLQRYVAGCKSDADQRKRALMPISELEQTLLQ